MADLRHRVSVGVIALLAPAMATCGGEDSDTEIVSSLPTGLPFILERMDEGDPVPASETHAFTTRYAAWLKQVGYFDYVLRSIHGVDASTGKRDYALWWTDVEAVKTDDTVTFRHLPSEKDHGGHNIITNNARLLAPAIIGALWANDSAASRVAEQICKGITHTMLGMVRDADDPLHHLMARNVVTFNHEFVTHDGRKKAVDYSAWFYPYVRWNCSRFKYEDNPHWGEVWVTNTRSKDDVGQLFRVSGWIRYASELARRPELRSACSETLELLQAFASDIVDNGYYIRTKDQEGQPYIASQTPIPGIDKISLDLDNYVTFDPLVPDSECNARRAADYLGYSDGTRNDCGDGDVNPFELMSLFNNYPNVNFFRAYHMANLLQSLIHGDDMAARTLLEGLVARLDADRTRDIAGIPVKQDNWLADLAFNLVQAAALGMPLTSTEVRLVQRYYLRALEHYEKWNHWDLWDPSIPDGSYSYKPPNRETTPDGEHVYWPRIQDMGAFIELCWSPFRNPSGAAPVDCDVIAEQMD